MSLSWTLSTPAPPSSVCKMAHKLAELAGGMEDCGETIQDQKLENTVHFLSGMYTLEHKEINQTFDINPLYIFLWRVIIIIVVSNALKESRSG
jgi:hypothetical protein